MELQIKSVNLKVNIRWDDRITQWKKKEMAVFEMDFFKIEKGNLQPPAQVTVNQCNPKQVVAFASGYCVFCW